MQEHDENLNQKGSQTIILEIVIIYITTNWNI
jgi:hypothetical protein